MAKHISAVEGNREPAYSSTLRGIVSEQVRPVAPLLLGVYLAACLALGIVAAISLGTGTPMSSFMSDPARVANVPPYTGLFSNLGALLWCASAAICLFSAAIMSRLGDRGVAIFFLASGLVTSVLLVDDLFMIHEKASEIYWRISEEAVFTAYGAMLALYLARFRRTILRTQYLPLLLAFGFMALSLLTDKLNDSEEKAALLLVLLEDGSKLLAIVSWLVYFTRLSAQRVLLAARPSEPELAKDGR
jgi:hypothetical protein